MSLSEDTRGGRHEAIWIQAFLAFTALFALLVARNVPPEFPKLPSLHYSSVIAVSNHGQRPHFDSDGSQWSAPVSVFLPFPPAAESTHLGVTPQLLSALQTKGFHYNRPPPVS